MRSVATGAVLATLVGMIVGSAALMMGPVHELTQLGRAAIEQGEAFWAATYIGLQFLAMVALPLVFGAVWIAVLVAHRAYTGEVLSLSPRVTDALLRVYLRVTRLMGGPDGSAK